jgi:AcrR family transcriptional regulator
MRSVEEFEGAGGPGDLTAKATIRNATLRLFAEHGPDAVSVRQIAAEAGVSPALVLHHFGNKAGLRDAVDEYAAQAFDDVIEVSGREDVVQILAAGDGGSIAQAFTRVFPPESPLPAYLRRLVLAGDPAGERLFARWFEAAKVLLDEMTRMGLASRSDDPDVRAAFLVANDLALILLRNPLRSALGFDPLEPDGMGRWAQEVSVVYRDGMWRDGDAADP